MTAKQSKRWVWGLFGLLVLIAAVVCSHTVYAQKSTEARRVKVGWYNSEHFQEGVDETCVKHGYSYEYLQGIANYTGWEYDYVYGGWAELYDAFIAGDIDVLAGVSKTKEREPFMNFPTHEMGFESYYIYKKSDNEEISGSDLSTLKGKKVGSISNNLMTDYFEAWMKKTKVDCEEVLFEDFESRDQAFEEGKIDAFIAVNNNIASNTGYTPVTLVGQSSYYLAVTKDRKDLLAQLNETLAALSESHPYFTDSLQIKYFQNTAVNAALSQKESEWVKEKGKIRVGYIDNYMPFCGSDQNRHVSGVLTDIMKVWQKQLNLQDRLAIEYVTYTSYDKMIKSLQSGKIDVAFPINDSIWVSEQEKIVQTNNLIESSVYLIYKGEYTEHSTDRIALSKHSPFQQTYAMMNYPDSEIIMAKGAQDCLDAVVRGDATCTFFNSGRAEEFMFMNEYADLNRLSLGTQVNYCLGVKKGNNVVYSLLERGVGLIDKSTMTNEMYKYANFRAPYTLRDFMSDNILLVVAIATIIIVLIISVAVSQAISLKRVQEQNIKEQKMLEVTQRQKEELEVVKDNLQEAVERAEQASKAKTTFLFNMSHDIRTPMNAILGFADLAIKSKESPDVVQDYLGKIKAAGDVLLSILNNVLEMSRIEKGTVTIDEEPCNFEKLNENLFTMFDEQMKQKNLKFTRSMSIDSMYVYCDMIKTREIFLNILSNAYKYTDAGGEVEMIIEELPSEREGYALFQTTIRDTGKGMSEEFLPTIFEEFAREKSSETRTIEGTGLGMAIVKKFVDLMEGTIEVESRLGIGTTFVVTIPYKLAKKEDVQDEFEGEERHDDFRGKKILLAEDMDINAEIAIAILEDEGIQVDRAKDGQDCVEKLKDQPRYYYHAILMDVQMPRLDGYGASRKIRSLNEPGRSDIPIIAMTANAFEEDKKNAAEAGMDGHVGKPIVVSDLFDELSAKML